MRRLLVVSLVTAITTSAHAAEPAPEAPIDWAKELAKDLVVTKGSTLVIDDYGLLDFGQAPRRRLRMKWHAEAPAKSFISRDSFVAVFNAMQTMMLMTFVIGDRKVSRDELGDFSYEPLTLTATAPVDMDFRFVLTKDGIDIAVTAEGLGPKLSSMSWAELYKRRAQKPSASASLSMVPGARKSLPASCQRYLDAFRACVVAMPESAQPFALASVSTMEEEWHGIEDHARLEPACKSALDSARTNMKTVCPKVEW